MTISYYKHYNQINLKKWPCKFFSPKEIACKYSGSIKVNIKLLLMLDNLRELLNKPIIITSAYRSQIYNSLIGGALRSYHLEARAFDISLKNQNKDQIIIIAKKIGFNGFGVNYNNFIHIDDGFKRVW